MHGINGLLYANLKNLSMCRQDKVSWHLIGLGNEVDMHTVTFYGATVMENQNRKDTVSLLPGEFMISGSSKSNSTEDLSFECPCLLIREGLGCLPFKQKNWKFRLEKK